MGSVEAENWNDIVIVGSGIGGLATALAFHRKGFKNVAVYERSNSLRTEGTAITIYSNGWHVLDQLGVGTQLRDKAVLIQGRQDILFDQDRYQRVPYPAGEARCLKRSDLINVLADALPPKTIQFGCNVAAVKVDPQSMYPTLQFSDGKAVQAKALIGCDGSNSIVAEYLGIKPATLFTLGSIRGLTKYPNGHSFPPLFTRMQRDKTDGTVAGRFPIDDKLVYWFVSLPLCWLDEKFPDDPELIKQATLNITKGYPAHVVEMIERSELDSLSFTRLRYRNPWDILVGNFHKGSVTVVGDAMHVMGPFLGQGGSAAMEDALVLARNLAQKFSALDQPRGGRQIMISHRRIGEAFDKYVKERRMRIVRLSTQTYLTGVILGRTSTMAKFIARILMVIFFRDPTARTKYDCGNL